LGSCIEDKCAFIDKGVLCWGLNNRCEEEEEEDEEEQNDVIADTMIHPHALFADSMVPQHQDNRKKSSVKDSPKRDSKDSGKKQSPRSSIQKESKIDNNDSGSAAATSRAGSTGTRAGAARAGSASARAGSAASGARASGAAPRSAGSAGPGATTKPMVLNHMKLTESAEAFEEIFVNYGKSKRRLSSLGAGERYYNNNEYNVKNKLYNSLETLPQSLPQDLIINRMEIVLPKRNSKNRSKFTATHSNGRENRRLHSA